MVFYTQFKRPEKVTEGPFAESKTEIAGYVSPQQQINNLINAGIRLEEWRKKMYLNGNEIQDVKKLSVGIGYKEKDLVELKDYVNDVKNKVDDYVGSEVKKIEEEKKIKEEKKKVEKEVIDE